MSDSNYSTKNYRSEGGDSLVIGGTIEILPGAAITGLPQAENQSDSAAEDVAELVADFNALLAKLKAAGLMNDDG